MRESQGGIEIVPLHVFNIVLHRLPLAHGVEIKFWVVARWGDSMKRWNGHFSRPSYLRCRSPQRSAIDPLLWRRYQSSHCLPNIATNAANSSIRNLAYRRSEVVTISVGNLFHVGSAAGPSSRTIRRLRLRRRGSLGDMLQSAIRWGNSHLDRTKADQPENVASTV